MVQLSPLSIARSIFSKTPHETQVRASSGSILFLVIIRVYKVFRDIGYLLLFAFS
jgi:hypothetical protein